MRKLLILICSLMTISVTAQDYRLTENKDSMKTLIVYFSFTAGNTKRIAEQVHNEVGGDLVRLETQIPYPSDYNQVVAQGKEEVKRGYKPELRPLRVEMNDYGRIIVGTPTWWYKMAPAELTFLSENDFTGKVVIPFMTNAGWPGSVIKDMSDIAKKNGARVENAREFRFSSNEKHFDRMETLESDLRKWIEVLK